MVVPGATGVARKYGNPGRPHDFRSAPPDSRWSEETVPGSLNAMKHTGSTDPPRRAPRDWAIDTGLFMAAAAYGVLISGLRVEDPHTAGTIPVWLFNLDQAVGLLACIALWFRRRWPLGLALVLIGLSVYLEMVVGAMLVAMFTVGTRRTPQVCLALLCSGVVASFAHALLRPELRLGYSVAETVFQNAILLAATVGWGLYLQHRRQLVVSLRERAEQAEAETRRSAELAKRQARDEMAREIHDVLGHRLSLLSLHAGALSYRPDMPREDLVSATTVLREGTHQALQDLREVIGVLRAPVSELPQPTLEDLPVLIEETRRAGMSVSLEIDTPQAPPDRVARAAYRITQEALTNARKHAPGAEVRVAVSGSPEEGLSVDVTNTPPAPTTDGEASRSSNQGLLGLSERVSLLRGHLEHGPTDEGGWRVGARLPWSP